MADIATWDRKGNWLEWKFPALPDRRVSSLHGQLNLLINLLSGNAPIHSSCKDVWGWGPTGSYSVAIGYNVILNYPSTTHNAKFWKHVWQSPRILKVIFFTWILRHQRALTGENLIKRGFFGPFWCCFCKQASESSAHIFVNCWYTQKAWAFLLLGLPVSIPYNEDLVNLFANWQNRYPKISSSSRDWR